MRTYKKYILGKIHRDEEGKEAFIYFEEPIEESNIFPCMYLISAIF